MEWAEREGKGDFKKGIEMCYEHAPISHKEMYAIIWKEEIFIDS